MKLRTAKKIINSKKRYNYYRLLKAIAVKLKGTFVSKEIYRGLLSDKDDPNISRETLLEFYKISSMDFCKDPRSYDLCINEDGYGSIRIEWYFYEDFINNRFKLSKRAAISINSDYPKLNYVYYICRIPDGALPEGTLIQIPQDKELSDLMCWFLDQ